MVGFAIGVLHIVTNQNDPGRAKLMGKPYGLESAIPAAPNDPRACDQSFRLL